MRSGTTILTTSIFEKKALRSAMLLNDCLSNFASTIFSKFNEFIKCTLFSVNELELNKNKPKKNCPTKGSFKLYKPRVSF